MIVVDANILVSCVTETTHSPLARRVAAKDPKWILPALWQYEVTSAITVFIRSRVLRMEQGIAAMEECRSLVAGREAAVDQIQACRLAVDLGISAYDAQYVALAQSYGVHCVSADQPLARKTPGLVIHLADFVA